jgi:hypothetical protein
VKRTEAATGGLKGIHVRSSLPRGRDAVAQAWPPTASAGRSARDGHGRMVWEKYPDSVAPPAVVASMRNVHRPGVGVKFAAKCP